MDIQEEVKEVIADFVGIPAEKIKNDMAFESGLGLDSLDAVELSMELEEKFEVEISDEELKELKTVGQVIDFVMKEWDLSSKVENKEAPKDEHK